MGIKSVIIFIYGNCCNRNVNVPQALYKNEKKKIYHRILDEERKTKEIYRNEYIKIKVRQSSIPIPIPPKQMKQF